MDSIYVLSFSLASVVAEWLAILWFFTKEQLQNMSGMNTATWRQKLAADIHQLIANSLTWSKK
jgi:hypothetical protein